METYFNINYEFDRQTILQRIDEIVEQNGKEYVCVADGVILNLVNRMPDYKEVINGAVFSLCDSAYVPLYIRWLYGLHYSHYTGSDIFSDITAMRKYRMMFLGSRQVVLDALRTKLTAIDPRIASMTFIELPFREVDDFDYAAIGAQVDTDNPDIIWVSLGAPKQEIFMNRLKPHIRRGVMISVGAAFKFHAGMGERRAPQWMLDNRLEFVYRIFQSPRKQLIRCSWIVRTLPGLLWQEWRRKREKK